MLSLKPPKVKCCTRIWHPNISEDGEVCLSLLRQNSLDGLGLCHIYFLNFKLNGSTSTIWLQDGHQPENWKILFGAWIHCFLFVDFVVYLKFGWHLRFKIFVDFKDLLNFDDPLNVKAAEHYSRNQVIQIIFMFFVRKIMLIKFFISCELVGRFQGQSIRLHTEIC